jgi:hypothetical protein
LTTKSVGGSELGTVTVGVSPKAPSTVGISPLAAGEFEDREGLDEGLLLLSLGDADTSLAASVVSSSPHAASPKAIDTQAAVTQAALTAGRSPIRIDTKLLKETGKRP